MSDQPSNQINITGNVSQSNIASNVTGGQNLEVNQPPEQVAAQIQALIEQLQVQNPKATEAEIV